MSSTLVDTLIRENQGIVYSAKIYKDDSGHHVQYFKNDQLIESRGFEGQPVERIHAAVNGWLNNIKVLKS